MSRIRHDRAGRGWPKVLGLVIGAALFALVGPPVFRTLSPTTDSHALDQRPTEVAANAPGIDAVSAPARLNYNYSVIPGGVQDAQELARAIQADEVVADHYRNVDPSTMHPQTVSVERMAYVSYRINDRVFWTKKPVRIYEGETILTNGETEIRARCGNGLSMAPLLPTSDDEPETTELDALTDTDPKLVAFGWPLAGVPSALTRPPLGVIGGDGISMAPNGLPFGGGVGGFGSGPNDGDPNETIPEDPPEALPFELGFSEFLLPEPNLPPTDSSKFDSSGFDPYSFGPAGFGPAGFDPGAFDPGAFDPGGFDDPSGFDPPGLGPLVLQPQLGDPTTFAATNAMPVPEQPATLLLLGSSIAGLLTWYRRQRSK